MLIGVQPVIRISPFNNVMHDGGRTTWRTRPRVGRSGHVSAMHVLRKASLVPFAYLAVETSLYGIVPQKYVLSPRMYAIVPRQLIIGAFLTETSLNDNFIIVIEIAR